MRTVVILVVVVMWWLTIVAVAPVPAEPYCYEFNCADNRPCRTDEGCLGPCYCNLELNECQPR